MIHGSTRSATDPRAPAGPGVGPRARARADIPAGPIGPLDLAAPHAGDPANPVVGAADGAVQQAWTGGGTDPFQVARRPQRALVIAVLAVVAIGVVAAFAARRHLIHATT